MRAATPPLTYSQNAGPSRAIPALAAVLVLAAALVFAWFIDTLQARVQTPPERAVLITGLFLAAALTAAPGIYLLRSGRKARPETTALVFLSACAVLLLAIYFSWVKWYVFFPADIWIWSEGDFVNDIVKFSTGYPLYTPAVNLDSTHYPPVPQLLTYLLATLAGKGWSIPAYRVIQLGYTAAAAFLATLSCRRILKLAWPPSQARSSLLWNGFCFAALFLMATNSITNRFAHNLHDDALAQAGAMAALFLLLCYIDNASPKVLAGMIVLAPALLFVKQNMLIWGLCYGLFLIVWGRSWKRTVIFAAASSLILAASVGVSYAVWGAPFLFWIFRELSTHAVSPLRAFQHLLDSWPYFAAGLLGGAAVLRGKYPAGLLGAWLICLGIAFLEAYTSGIEWMLNHIGPGCLMAGIWFLAGLASFWRNDEDLVASAGPAPAMEWVRAGAVAVSIALMFSGLGLVRIPLRPVSDDAYRYVRDIEKEFQGQPAGNVLLDVGSWVYMKNRVVIGDRATAAGMLGMAKVDGFSGILSRIAAKRYSKILVRSFYKDDFWYENTIWPEPSGVRQALLDNYRVTGSIRAAEGPKDVKNWAEDPHLFGEITILEPKNGTAASPSPPEPAPAH